jgi:hypothetical protein
MRNSQGNGFLIAITIDIIGKLTEGLTVFAHKGGNLMRRIGINWFASRMVHKPKVRPFWGSRMSHGVKVRTPPRSIG